MRFRNNEKKFGAVSQGFHWGVAAIVFTLLPLGWYMHDLPRGIEKYRLVELHKSLGLLVLGLMIGRSLWRAFNPPPPLPAGLPNWEHRAAQLSHWGIYAVIFAQVMIGMSIVWAANSPLTFFGWFALPSPVSPDKAMQELAEEAHEILAYALCVLLAVHIGAALRHHFVLKNDILRRMLPLALIVFAVHISAPVKAATWNLLPESKILFHFVQEGVNFTGNFKNFEARIEFDPDKPEDGRIKVTIDTASLDTQNGERDALLRSRDLFDVEKWPRAEFTAGHIRVLEPGRFEAAGALSIRDITRPASLPFTLKIDKLPDGDVKASASGELIISRKDYGVGQGEWAGTGIVPDEVKIEVKIEALQQR